MRLGHDVGRPDRVGPFGHVLRDPLPLGQALLAAGPIPDPQAEQQRGAMRTGTESRKGRHRNAAFRKWPLTSGF